MREPNVLWGTSFDAIAVSGVVVEFVKLAEIFMNLGYLVHLDLGYDIKEDKGNFFKPYADEVRWLPAWVHLDRIDDLDHVPGYNPGFVRQVLRDVVQKGEPDGLLPRVDAVSAAVARRIIQKWERLGVSFVIVENGTLPENIAYTKGLYAAIEAYGRARGLDRYVLWRDHDLMWSSEPGVRKYGEFPYRAAVRPVNSSFIQYIALHDEARRKMAEWVPGLQNIEVLQNTFTYAPAVVNERNADFRRRFGIPENAFLIGRYTRIIPQKRIDRDIHLLAAVNIELAARGTGRSAYLVVAGDTGECPAEHSSLSRLAGSLGVGDRVVFTGQLAPAAVSGGANCGFSVRDLLAHADLASFLTSYDYESYGNPIGEAIASCVPYITTRYKVYDAVYGDKGFQALVLEIAAHKDHLPSREFAAVVTDLLVDEAQRRAMAEFNHRLGRPYFAPGRAERLVRQVCRPHAPQPASAGVEWPVPPMGAQVRMSVVVPVFNEAHNIASVLQSISDQRDDRGTLDPTTYEVILVDNNSTDDTVEIAEKFAAEHPELAIHVIRETEQGVACARKAGMDLAARRSHQRDREHHVDRPFYLVSADADCVVDQRWLGELLRAMTSSGTAIGVCDYYYPACAFIHRPRLWEVIQRTLRCRQVAWRVFGGFPDGKGFAVDRDKYERIGGIEISYQLKDGRFACHLSDDWDFGIKMRASSESIVYVPASRVQINPRRVDHTIGEVIAGKAYGTRGIITMRNVRVPRSRAPDRLDLSAAQARQAWEFSIKDFTPKNMILPLLLTPSFAEQERVWEFLTRSLAERLVDRAAEMKAEMSLTDFLPMHSYKTPCYRLYLEFAEELFTRLRVTAGADIGHPPPLPTCLAAVPKARFRELVRYYCEDRESGEAHDYFGNGGVF